ncbi:taurine ABC transporter substrate-binding protein [Burkholderia multivorans]|uniref:Taurine ABC transporter, periplasmic binding protein n=1 Tax=Burkholderia multivorans CGD2 TaxID=513052 RepID=B9BVQ6_9BURK|nr:taurine ABC transporter substrate-binding protein [Burkholderia multivorans]AJY18313.1 taurine ABC transporter, periplasmic binding protein [Burkholderia multivorans ATCC BAA-247]AVR23283.1 taurine ABC transporter substrate-binding protein [Burkholderia multivorans]EEE05078.1 taurine ABC transporter, periplasmic binding protein [Burkholderia multivorans CGD2]EEE12537.1 taurine ABC transporter, periplasmic binding protein [Burkholderia multivorans CGD2M]EJO55961.1 taurine ABC transporter, pe
MSRFSFVRRAVVALTAFAALGAAHAESREVVIAYQDMVVPWRYAQASGEVEKATGYKVTFRKLDSGADVIRALASGSVQLGEAGSSPIAAGLSQGLDISLFWVLDNINDAEALVARNGSGVTSIAALKGKKIGVPFVSTSHFHTLVALQAAGVNPNDVKIVNLRPPEVAAAWTRGDIDATYIWDPVLAKVKQSGTVLTTSGQVAKESGKATFDGFVVNRKFARENPEFVTRFVKVLAAADADYRAHTAAWKVGSPQVEAVAKVSGANAQDVPASLALYAFPTPAEQASSTWLGGGAQSGAAKSLAATAAFLKSQGTIQTVLSDYSVGVDPQFVQKAAR